MGGGGVIPDQFAAAVPDIYGANSHGCYCRLRTASHARYPIRGAGLCPNPKLYTPGNALCGCGNKSLYYQYHRPRTGAFFRGVF